MPHCGAPDPISAETAAAFAKAQGGRIEPGTIGCIALVMLVFGWCSSSIATREHTPDPEIDARVLCQDAVKAQLRSPSTADFGSYSETTARAVEGKPGQWIVAGKVTAVNAFNAPITNGWVCDADVERRTGKAVIVQP